MKAMWAMMAATLLAATAGAALGRDGGDDFAPREPALKQAGHYEWNWDGKDSLSLEAPVLMHYTPGGAPRIVATGPEEMLAHLRVGQGRIRFDDNYSNHADRGRVEVTVTGITVHNLALSGSGRAMVEKLDLDHLNLSISGSGSLQGAGRGDQLNLTVSGSGKADLTGFSARSANIHISGSGKVQLTPRDEANISITGSGVVQMAARPAHFSQSINGSGRVRIDGN